MDIQSGNGGAGGDSGAAGAGAGGSDGFMAGLSADNQAFATEQGFQSADAVFDGFRGLQEKLSGSIALPGQDATPEQQADFYKAASQTWTPQDGYKFNMPEGMPETLPYDQGFANKANAKFKELGLHPTAAQSLHDFYVGEMAGLHGQQTEAANQKAQQQAEAMEKAHGELVKEYGDPESDGYKNVVAKATRAQEALTKQGIDVSLWFAEKGILTEPDAQGNQQVMDSTAVKLLALIHDKALTEDGLDGLGDFSGPNPFDKTKGNLTEASKIQRENPELAKRLKAAAGWSV